MKQFNECTHELSFKTPDITYFLSPISNFMLGDSRYEKGDRGKLGDRMNEISDRKFKKINR